ncbi:MAG: 2-oxoacid:acceptor oxidoreductase family protein, partial [Desulfobacterales bacterium]|nr:2-oxoacid:acceptor oxidoreductase family protein [Desulfobacterales bacterium]
MAELSVWIAGEAGQGMVTVGQILSKAVVRSGLHLLVQQDYMSRIRGGLNSWRMRCGDGELFGPREEADVLVALSPEAAKGYGRQLCKEGLLLVDERLEMDDQRALALPLSELDAVRFPGTVALAACSHFMGLAPHVLDEVMGSFFSGETLEENRAVFFRAMEWAEKTIPQRKLKIPKTFPPALTLNGNEAIALGALAAGCNFAAYYPMTPATSVVQTLIDHQNHTDLHVEQVEDEISAINMALGASYAGARAMVATSGGGLALMSEGVSLSGITETPVVIVLAQRPGPATGLPTRTEQGDLDLARFCGHGEFSRAILAPDSPAACFELTRHAFDLAERFQGPVFILTDQFLADSVRNTPCFDFSNRTQPASPLLYPLDSQPYQRYALGHEGGVSPRLVPGFSKALVVTDSDEHTPDGHLTEDHGIRVAMQ